MIPAEAVLLTVTRVLARVAGLVPAVTVCRATANVLSLIAGTVVAKAVGWTHTLVFFRPALSVPATRSVTVL